MGRGSRGRSSGRPFIRRAGSSSDSGVGGCEDDSELPWKDWKEEMMLLPLEERCEFASEMYTKEMRSLYFNPKTNWLSPFTTVINTNDALASLLCSATANFVISTT